MNSQGERPSVATAAILTPSAPVPQDAIPVIGPNFEKDWDLSSFLQSYKTIGFQANSFGNAVDIVNEMVYSSDDPVFGADSLYFRGNGGFPTKNQQVKSRMNI